MRLTGLADLTPGLTDLNPQINTSHFNQIFGFLKLFVPKRWSPVVRYFIIQDVTSETCLHFFVRTSIQA